MSDKTPDKEFWDVADSFIAVANDHCDHMSSGKVSSAMLYSVARFNSFIAASSAKNKEEFVTDREKTVAYFVGQFEKMFRDNFDDYEANYGKYIQK